jgi:serine protease
MKINVAAISVVASAMLAACGGSTEGPALPSASTKVLTESSLPKATAKRAVNEIPSEYASRTSTSDIVEDGQYDQFIVYYRKSTLLKGANDSAAATSNNARVASSRNIAIAERRTTATNGHVIQTSRGMSASEAQAFMVEYLKSQDVEYIEPDVIVHPALMPNDELYSQQWGMSGGTAGISLANAWDKATGKGVVVAVVDTGITTHSDLAGQVLPGYNFVANATFDRNRTGRSPDASDPGDWLQGGDSCPASGGPYYVHNSTWHGTHVAGIIAAKTNNGIGVAGSAFNSKILPVRALGRCGGFTSDINDAIVWASGGPVPGVPNNPNPAKVINLSLSGNGQCSKTNQDAIDIARGNGAIIVQAAGNQNLDASQTYTTPACEGVIVVGATNSSGNRASFSNYGSLVNIMAPGDTILSTFNAGFKDPGAESYGYMSGTSQATPHAAGAVALMLEQQPTLTVEQIKNYLSSTATSMNDRCPEGCGAGLVNADKALARLPIPVDGDLPQTHSGDDGIYLKADSVKGSTYRILIPENTEMLRIDYLATNTRKATIRSESDSTWSDCSGPPYLLAYSFSKCWVWNPKPGYYYVNFIAFDENKPPYVKPMVYLNGGHMQFGDSITRTAKKPYLPVVVTIDNAPANTNVNHSITIYNPTHFAMAEGYGAGGNLFEKYESRYAFSNVDPDPGSFLSHYWIAAQANIGTASGTGPSGSNGNLKMILTASPRYNDEEVQYTYSIMNKSN